MADMDPPTPSRRSFLAAAATAAIPASLLACAAKPIASARKPAVAPAATGRRDIGDTLGLGFIGMGKRGFELLPSFLDQRDCRVLAVCDVDTTRREHAKALVDRHAGNTDCRALVDHHDLLATPGVDGVVIASPDHWHIYHVLDACRAGKDIYCEKPLTDTLLECRLMIEAARRHNIVFQTGSQQRSEYDGRFVTACETVRSGRLGQLLTVHVGIGPTSAWCDLPAEPMEPGLDWDRWLGPAPRRPYHSALSPRGVHNHYPDWRKYREYAGGMVTDWGAHHFDIVQWALEMDESGPVEALPPSDNAGPQSSPTFGAKLVYASGIEVVHGGTNGVLFVGTEGSLFVSRDRLSGIPDKVITDPLPAAAARLPRVGSHIRNWIDCVRTRHRPICDVEVGARSIACAHLCNLAYWHRRDIHWNPSTWAFSRGEPASWLDRERRSGYGVPTHG